MTTAIPKDIIRNSISICVDCTITIDNKPGNIRIVFTKILSVITFMRYHTCLI